MHVSNFGLDISILLIQFYILYIELNIVYKMERIIDKWLNHNFSLLFLSIYDMDPSIFKFVNFGFSNMFLLST
jgi:hypothetical protein